MELPFRFLFPLRHLTILLLIQSSQSATVTRTECPTDCACYQDYLTNLASWKWIDTGTEDTEEYRQNGPHYLEHNEVFQDPLTAFKNQRRNDPMLATVTCIIRTAEPSSLTRILSEVPQDTQMMSILQAPGSGKLVLTRNDMGRFPSLVGLELQGVTLHSNDNDTSLFRLQADALIGNPKLTYLNLEKVLIEQRKVENQVLEEVYVKVRTGGDENDDEDNSVHLLYVGEKKEELIVPYSEFKRMRKNGSNELPPLPSLKSLDPKIAVAFTQLSELVHLRISACNMLDISWDMFYKLQRLKYLLLENNDLLFLPDFVFYATPNLTALSLAGNRILNLQTVGLAGLLHLENLDVTHNNITHLSELSLPPFPHLEVADFRYNPIETIFPNTFEVMNTTRALYLGNPNVPLEFLANSFYGLISLQNLELRNVKIGALERPMLRGMPELLRLHLDGTIPSVFYDAFTELPKLEKLSLRNAGVKKISMDAFYGLNRLEELDLSHNNLEFLPPGLLDYQVNLRELYLDHNKLETLPMHLFDRLPAKIIRLDGNPWHCNCDMTRWDPKVINVVKRTHIVRNATACDMSYTKGMMCGVESVSLETKYIPEKRVSPICRSPAKFAKKTVFQAQRKGLQACEGTKKIRKDGNKTLTTELSSTTPSTQSNPKKRKPEYNGGEVPQNAKSSSRMDNELFNTIHLASMDPLLEHSRPYYRQLEEVRLHKPAEAPARIHLKTGSMHRFSHRLHVPRRLPTENNMVNQTVPNVSKKSLKLGKILRSRSL